MVNHKTDNDDRMRAIGSVEMLQSIIDTITFNELIPTIEADDAQDQEY